MRKLLFILLVGIVVSCGAKKVHKEKIETVEAEMVLMTVSDSIGIKTDVLHNVVITTDTEEEEITITPIDTTKEIHVDGKTYKNVVINKKTKKDKSKSQDTTSIKKDSISETKGRTLTFDIKEAKLDITSKEKEEPWIFYLSAFGFLLLLLLLYYLYRKYLA